MHELASAFVAVIKRACEFDIGADRIGFFETGPDRTGSEPKIRFTGPDRTGPDPGFFKLLCIKPDHNRTSQK